MTDRNRQQQSGSDSDRERQSTRDGPFGGVSFELPPITFPSFFPEDFTIRIPVPKSVRTAGNPLLAAIAIDLIDVLIILTIGSAGGWLRVLLGTAVTALVFGPFGLLYGLEAIPLVGRIPILGVVPTATAVALSRRVR